MVLNSIEQGEICQKWNIITVILTKPVVWGSAWKSISSRDFNSHVYNVAKHMHKGDFDVNL